MNRRTNIRSSAAGAFSLIEVTIALGIAAFCLVTVFGLLPLGLTSNQDSVEQTAACNISSAIIADLRTLQVSGTNASPRFNIPVPTAPSGGKNGPAETSGTTIYLSANGANPSGQVILGGTGVSRYRATIGFYFPSAGQYTSSRTATTVRILITWPALADPTPSVWHLGSSAVWPTNYTGSYEADTTLDGN